MHILVTGAAGFIGSHLAERLAALGHTVVGLDNFSSYYARVLKEMNAHALRQRHIEVLPLDLAMDDLAQAVRDVDVIYHLAAQPGLSAGASFNSYLRDNVIATQRLIEAAGAASRLRAFINIATSSVYGADATRDETAEPRPTSDYGVTKLAAEQLVMAHQRERGLPACSFRLFSVYGPRERPDKLFPTLIRCLLRDEAFPLFEGSEHHRRSFTYVADIVDGLTAALPHLADCLGQIFNLGAETSVTTGEAIQIVEGIIGKRAVLDRRPRRAGDQTRTQANIAKARRVLGYHPATLPQAGLTEAVTWYREHLFGEKTAA